MERKKWVPIVVGLVVVASVVAVLFYILTTGMTSGCQIWITADMGDPHRIDDGAWEVVISDVSATCDPKFEDVAEFSIMLRKDNETIIPISDLRDGYVTNDNDVFVFFEDNNRGSRLDSGDVIYLVGLEPDSNYTFYLIWESSAELVDYTFIQT